MTWGQFRFQLQTELAGVPLDLLDQWLNNRYEQVIESSDWLGKKYHYTLQTTAAYQSGADSVTLTVGSANVTGVGTAWTSTATLGMRFYRPGDAAVYQIVQWNSATSFVLDRAYEGNGSDATGTVYSGAKYVYMQNIYSLPADVGAIVNCLDPVTGFPLRPFSKDELDQSAGPRTLVNDPTSWAPYDDTNDAAPPVVHQIELFPPPLRARGIAITYLHSAAGFDGSNTGGGPMPWVSSSVLLSGCKADGYAYKAAQAEDGGSRGAYLQLAKMHKTEFEEELARLLRMEHMQRRQKVPMRMAGRFTRHRLARAGRGLSNNWGPGAGGPN